MKFEIDDGVFLLGKVVDQSAQLWLSADEVIGMEGQRNFGVAAELLRSFKNTNMSISTRDLLQLPGPCFNIRTVPVLYFGLRIGS